MKNNIGKTNYSIISTYLFAILLWSAQWHSIPILRSVWYRLMKIHENINRTFKARLHGFSAILNKGNKHPILAIHHPYLNAPLVEIVAQTYDKSGNNALVVVDVGAACGDTVLLLEKYCSSMIGHYICVDGDTEFLELLAHNVKQLGKVTIQRALLSDQESCSIPKLIRTHGSTASAQGETTVIATTLDAILDKSGRRIDVIKIDVDGFDGRVLGGALKTLKEYRPSIIFEWHPQLIKITNNPILQAFDILEKEGYNQLLFFTKYGKFSHFMTVNDKLALIQLADFCQNTNLYDDWHYDIIAIHSDIKFCVEELASLNYYRSRMKV